MRRADDDAEVDVVILTGADPAFCAGLDLKELGSGDHDFAAGARPTRRALRGPIPTMTKPVIGAINGVAITGGFELALHCAFLVASERARFADTHSRVGIQPGWGLTVLLAEAVGVRRAGSCRRPATSSTPRRPWRGAWSTTSFPTPNSCRSAVGSPPTSSPAIRWACGNPATYAEQQLVDRAGAWDLEPAAAREWLRGGGGSAEAIEARRHSIMARGRAQSGN